MRQAPRYPGGMRLSTLCLLASSACQHPRQADHADVTGDAHHCATNDARVCVPASVLAQLPLEDGEYLHCGGLCGGDVVTIACRPEDANASSSDAANESSGANDPQCGDLAALICTFESDSCHDGT